MRRLEWMPPWHPAMSPSLPDSLPKVNRFSTEPFERVTRRAVVRRLERALLRAVLGMDGGGGRWAEGERQRGLTGTARRLVMRGRER